MHLEIKMKLVPFVIQSFRVAKVFNENSDRINSINFTSDGNTLISSSDDDSIVMYDCEKGVPKRTLHSKKYGADLVRFAQDETCAVHSSTKIDDTIRYLSLHDNKYIRYFSGHTKKIYVLPDIEVNEGTGTSCIMFSKGVEQLSLGIGHINVLEGLQRVVSLDMSPIDDSFISGSLDKTVRLWDLRSQNCQGLTNEARRPFAAFDPEGVIFAVASDAELRLYDLRSYDKGPFKIFVLPKDKDCEHTGLKFSPNGKFCVITTSGPAIHLLDAYTGKLVSTFSSRVNTKGMTLEACFSPDSQFIFSGSTDGTVHVWNSDTGASTAVLKANSTHPVNCVLFNPKYMMLVSASTTMAFWLPTLPEDD